MMKLMAEDTLIDDYMVHIRVGQQPPRQRCQWNKSLLQVLWQPKKAGM